MYNNDNDNSNTNIIELTEAWPFSLKKTNKKEVGYVCSRSVGNKNSIKKVSAQNSMIPAQVPRELQELTQTNFSR